jgi:hypothetical protein
MSQYSTEELAFLNNCRERYRAGESVDIADMKRYIVLLRQRRVSALEASSSAKPKAKKSPPSAAALASALDDLDAL